MAQYTPLEEDITDALEDWALQAQGVRLNQKNPYLFIQILRQKGYEITKYGDIQKIRNEHKVITKQVLDAYNELLIAKRRIDLIEASKKDVLKGKDNKKNDPE